MKWPKWETRRALRAQIAALEARLDEAADLKVTGFDVDKHGAWAIQMSHEIIPLLADALSAYPSKFA